MLFLVVRRTGLIKGSSIAVIGGSGKVKVSVMVPVIWLVSMLIKHVGGEVGMRISVRIW